MKRLLKCTKCGSYTMKETHSCGGNSLAPKPAKWSPEDKYGRYRREAKKEEMIEKGFL